MPEAQCPQRITPDEFSAKLNLLRSVLSSYGYVQIYLQSEGALRWLTGRNHQVIDIPAYEATSIQALVSFVGDKPILEFTCDPWEKARLLDFIDNELGRTVDTEVSFIRPDQIPGNGFVLMPETPGYWEILRKAVSPLAEGLEGNQFAKLQWLIGESRRALIDCAASMEEGMDGWEVRSLIYSIFHTRNIELSMVLPGLSGMEHHLHPIWNEENIVQKGTIIKLAVNARFADMYHSATQLAVLGGPVKAYQQKAHTALQDAALAYADLYRAGAKEGAVYDQLGTIFKNTAEAHALPGFETSAYLHHPGGPLSPLGSRDFLLQGTGKRIFHPWSQFAVNPVDSLTFSKFELQGIITPKGPPLILDEFSRCGDDPVLYDTKEFYGQPLRLPTILIQEEMELQKEKENVHGRILSRN